MEPATVTTRASRSQVRIDWRVHERNMIRNMLGNLLEMAGRELNGKYDCPPLVAVVELDGELLAVTSPRELPRDEVEHLLCRAVAEMGREDGASISEGRYHE